MKKQHLILLIITSVMAVFSAYSLAAINQVYSIGFQWYSQYYDKYSAETRVITGDRWGADKYTQDIRLEVITDEGQLKSTVEKAMLKEKGISNINFKKYIALYCSLGEVFSPEYRLKVAGIAQRGNVVEVKVSINSPLKEAVEAVEKYYSHRYCPSDFVRIERSSFPLKGKLYFIFKNQAGSQLAEKQYVVD